MIDIESIDNSPTELTTEDFNKYLESMCTWPKKCVCGNGLPVRYEVTSSNGEIYDLMCVRCFQKITKDGQAIQIGN